MSGSSNGFYIYTSSIKSIGALAISKSVLHAPMGAYKIDMTTKNCPTENEVVYLNSNSMEFNLIYEHSYGSIFFNKY